MTTPWVSSINHLPGVSYIKIYFIVYNAFVMPFIGNRERRVFTAVIIGAAGIAGCTGRSSPQRQASEGMPKPQSVDCLDLQPRVDACASRADFSLIEGRLNTINIIVSTAKVSPQSVGTLAAIQSTLRIMQSEGRIRWYTYKNPDLFGTTQIGRKRVPLPLSSDDFFVNVVVPRSLPDRVAEVLGVTIHEGLHAKRAYQRFKQGSDPIYDITPPQEEYDAEFIESLIEGIAKHAGLPSKNSPQIVSEEGIDAREVVLLYDRLRIHSSDQLFHFISDMRQRYQLKRLNDVLYSSGQGNSPTIQLNQDKIVQLEALYRDYPPVGSSDRSILEEIRRHQEWISPSFFPPFPEPKNMRPDYGQKPGDIYAHQRYPTKGFF